MPTLAPVVHSKTTRRSFLAAAVAAIGGIWLYKIPTASPIASNDEQLFKFSRRLVRILAVENTMIGSAQQKSLDTNLSKLVGNLLGVEDGDWRAFGNRTDGELRTRLRDRILNDYRFGNLRAANGWRLSETEIHALELADHCCRSERLLALT
jgi:hypothetical protein